MATANLLREEQETAVHQVMEEAEGHGWKRGRKEDGEEDEKKTNRRWQRGSSLMNK
jgi:hypothetical protein